MRRLSWIIQGVGRKGVRVTISGLIRGWQVSKSEREDVKTEAEAREKVLHYWL